MVDAVTLRMTTTTGKDSPVGGRLMSVLERVVNGNAVERDSDCPGSRLARPQWTVSAPTQCQPRLRRAEDVELQRLLPDHGQVQRAQVPRADRRVERGGAGDFAVGDPVFGVCERGQEGTYAEKIAMDQAVRRTMIRAGGRATSTRRIGGAQRARGPRGHAAHARRGGRPLPRGGGLVPAAGGGQLSVQQPAAGACGSSHAGTAAGGGAGCTGAPVCRGGAAAGFAAAGSGVHGSAAGIGAALAMTCDLLIMGEKAKISVIFTNLGLIPDGGATWLLQQALGYRRTLQIIAEGGHISSQECFLNGLANKVVRESELLTETQKNLLFLKDQLL